MSVPKENGSLRFCVNFCRLGAVTVRASYPVPRMDDFINSFGKARKFLISDTNSVNCKTEVDERVINMTAYVAHDGLYKYTRLPVGFKHVPASFQRAMTVILATKSRRTLFPTFMTLLYCR